MPFRELPSQAPAHVQNPARPRRARVVMGILLTLLLGGSSLGMLFYRAVTLPEPGYVVVVRANSEWDGAELAVESSALREPSVTQFNQLGNYTVPFFFTSPGQYTLHVKSLGEEVYTKQFELGDKSSKHSIDLVEEGATTRPSTRPATHPT